MWWTLFRLSSRRFWDISVWARKYPIDLWHMVVLERPNTWISISKIKFRFVLKISIKYTSCFVTWCRSQISHLYIHIRTHIYTYTQIHTYTHTHTRMGLVSVPLENLNLRNSCYLQNQFINILQDTKRMCIFLKKRFCVILMFCEVFD